ncbi:VOC family protein [Sphingomonas montanisoli]|uniref:VOC family protein n=1 Tax=Sphingomonas montanisoli TaxID=2606412 RepID=A0A5D9C805_9SPHN|nr:VOC family protein [Sphingomonas montanisoli]TZG28008.1 VOC family protein [Sphingomonas montanisoli]
MSKITTCLWFKDEAEDAANYYASILPNTRVDRVTCNPADAPGGPEGSVLVVEFTLLGTPMLALNGGVAFEYNECMSLSAECADQAEVDLYWDALIADGKPEQCGWLRDKYNVPWQITPKVLMDIYSAPDKARAARAMRAMMTMVKIDVAKVLEAADGI